ncbi:MAG: hypothetical protein ACI4XM_04640 [Candidatus Coprovivens sp.]
MISNEISADGIKQKLYQKARSFKNFENLNEDDLVRISKKVYYKQESNQEPTLLNLVSNKLSKYLNTLRYLTNPQIHIELPNYDERIIYLIMSSDPDLVIYKEFLKRNITTIKEINSEQDIRKKEELIEKRSIEIMEYQAKVRSLIGFYDSQLLKFEEIYFKKFTSKYELITDVRQDYTTKLLAIVPLFKNLSPLSQKRYKELQEKATIWLNETHAINNLHTVAYSCNIQKETIGLNSILEQLVFFILVADPNLKCLQIYEEESKMSEVQRRIEEEFGYYNINLILLEKIYHQAFCPDKELSPWTLKKQ